MAPRRTRALAALLAAAAVLIAVAVVGISGAGQAPPPFDPEAAGVLGVEQQRSDPNNIVFDPDSIRTYQIELSPASLDTLRADPTAEQYVEGFVTIDGERFGPIGVRYKGFFGVLRFCFDERGNQRCPKLAYKLKFNEYQPYLRFHGLKRLNFHPMGGDPSQMRESLSYEVFRAMGVPAPRSVHAWLELNGEPLGLFTLTENIDERFIADRFRDGGRGVLYKEVWPINPRAFGPFGGDVNAGIAAGPDDPAGMLDLADALEAASQGPDSDQAVLDAFLANQQDPDAIWRYLAVDRLADNWDGIAAWYCVPECANHNYFWYQDALSGDFTLIPWDVEHTWEFPSPIRTNFGIPDWDDVDQSCDIRQVFFGINARAPHCDPLMGALARQGWEPYIEHSRQLIDDVYPLERLHQRIDEIAALIGDYVAQDPNNPNRFRWQGNVAALKRQAAGHYGYIQAKIDAWDDDGSRPTP